MHKIKRHYFMFLAIALLIIGTMSNYAANENRVKVKISNSDSGVVLLDQNENGLTVRMDIGKLELIPVKTKAGVFVLPRIDGFSRSFNEGEPTLPVSYKLISVPFGSKLKTEVLDYKTMEFKLSDYNFTVPLMPVQPSLRKSQDLTTVPFVFNKVLYSQTDKYALPLAKVESLGIMRDTNIGRIAISPIEYNPAQNSIKVYTSVTVRVNYTTPNWEKTRNMKKKYASVYFEPVNNHLLNYEAAATEADLVKYPIKYAIVANRMFESQLQPFIEWKTKKGYKVVVGYTDTIGTTTTAIKSWIQGLYTAGTTSDPAPSFVLLVGDVQQIPAFSGSAGTHITDLRYCEFTGDNFPEIYYGRFSAQTTTDLQPQIDKTLEYEQYTNLDHSYLANATLVSGVDSSYAATYGNGAINYGTNNYFNTAHGFTSNVWLYPASDGSTAPTDILTTISNGVSFYMYTAHSSHEGPSDPHFLKTDIPSISNNHKYFLGIGNSCQSNTFGTDVATTPCFGEAILQVANKGAIGWIGASDYTYWDEDYWWAVGNGSIVAAGPTYAQTGIGVLDGLFHDHGEAVSLHYTTNGSMLFAGSTAVTEAGSSRSAYYWEEYHLMGDPSVMTYLGIPTTNSVSHPSSVTTSATSITVSAAEGSYVGITKGGVLYGAGYIGTSGSAAITITPFGSSGTADIVVTAQNKIPYVSTISVASGNVAPTANFSGTPTSGVVPLTVSFTDLSTENPTSWSWNFGDGGTSTAQNPSHQYTATGTYTVTLTATNAYGNDSETKTNYITVTSLAAPVAAFTASATSIVKGSSVTFTDQSSNNPTSWSWTITGGTPSTSTSQNPTVTYNTAGTYSVSLTATNAAGSNTLTKTNYITVTEPTYCSCASTNCTYEWISSVKIGSVTKTSTASNYSDFTSTVINMTRGASVSLTLTPKFKSTKYTEYWKVWIDYNKDGDFGDTGEQVYSGSGTSAKTGSFTVPSTALTGNTRIRVVMRDNSTVPNCGTFTYGEVEDYTANIQ